MLNKGFARFCPIIKDECKKDICEWWYINARGKGRCAIHSLSAIDNSGCLIMTIVVLFIIWCFIK